MIDERLGNELPRESIATYNPLHASLTTNSQSSVSQRFPTAIHSSRLQLFMSKYKSVASKEKQTDLGRLFRIRNILQVNCPTLQPLPSLQFQSNWKLRKRKKINTPLGGFRGTVFFSSTLPFLPACVTSQALPPLSSSLPPFLARLRHFPVCSAHVVFLMDCRKSGE